MINIVPISQLEKQRLRNKEGLTMFPQGIGAGARGPGPCLPLQHLDLRPHLRSPHPPCRGPQENLSQDLTKCCSRSSRSLPGRTLCLDGSKDTFPGPHICFHAGPTGKPTESPGGHSEWALPQVRSGNSLPGWGLADMGTHLLRSSQFS